jgi:tRNA 2-thiouridine synthesizing protein A
MTFERLLSPAQVRSTRMLQGITADKEIDTRGLNCPLPILRAKKALSDMATGQVLKIVATDPGSMRDFQAFCKQTGNELLVQQTINKEFVHFLKRR